MKYESDVKYSEGHLVLQTFGIDFFCPWTTSLHLFPVSSEAGKETRMNSKVNSTTPGKTIIQLYILIEKHSIPIINHIPTVNFGGNSFTVWGRFTATAPE